MCCFYSWKAMMNRVNTNATFFFDVIAVIAVIGVIGVIGLFD